MSETLNNKSEPKVIAEGYTESEVFDWMRKKIAASQQLNSALAERDYLLQALSSTEENISQLTRSAALGWLDKAQDPTPLP